MLGLVAAVAHGAAFVSEGVTFDAETNRFTYRYAIDNRLGTETVTDVAVLVIRDASLYQLSPLAHTSPEGWTFVTSVGGPDSVKGTFQEWNNSDGVPPHGYLSGFSLITGYPPAATTEPNYFLFRVPSGELDIGTVPAPAVPAIPPAPSIPTMSVQWLIAFSLIMATEIGRAHV